MPEYTAFAVLSVVLTLLGERFWLRTGIFRQGQYWLAMAVISFFQVLVEGWLTRLSAPTFIYDPDQIIGLRFPWDIPVEDYLFAFSMLTVTLMLWVRAGDRGSGEADRNPESPAGEHVG